MGKLRIAKFPDFEHSREIVSFLFPMLEKTQLAWLRGKIANNSYINAEIETVLAFFTEVNY